MLTFLHTADIHFGKKFVHLGERGKAQRKQIKTTFSKFIDLAIECEVHGVLIAGDIFDSERVSEIDFQFFVKELKRLSAQQMYSFVIAGNHDYLFEASVFNRKDFQSDKHIVFFDTEKTSIEIPELDLTVFGASCISKKSTKSPLSLFDNAFSTTYGVGIIHGSFAIPEKHTPDSYPFTVEEIEASGLHYVACGDWHSYLELPSKKTKAAYSGSPEALDFDQTGAGKALLVKVGSETKIEPIDIGAYSFKELELDVTGKEDILSFIEKEAAALAGDKVIFQLSLSGIVSPGQLISDSKITELLEDHFYHIRVTDKTALEVGQEALMQYPEEMVSGKFIRIMQEKIAQAATDEEKEVLEKALQVGLMGLEGR